MALWEDPRFRIPEGVALRMALMTKGMTQKVVQAAVGSGLAIVSVGVGRLLVEGACRELGETPLRNVRPHSLAA